MKIDDIDADVQTAKALPQAPKLMWQFAVKRLRVWNYDDDTDRTVRPYLLLVLELYPRGAPVASQLARPVAQYPSPLDALTMLFKQMIDPSEDEKRQRPTQISFTDKTMYEFCRKPLAACGIEVAQLTLADGVDEYVRKYSSKLIERGRASRGDAADRRALITAKGIDKSMVETFYDHALDLLQSQPWEGIAENVAIEATDSKTGITGYLSVLGKKDATKGFTIMDSMNSLRRKHKRVQGTYDYEKDVRLRMMCGNCGKEPTAETAFRCMGCKRMFYCDETCQKADWPTHRNECGNPKAMENMTRSVWNKREQAFVFLDPTSVPFDELDYAEENRLWRVADIPVFPMCFVNVQTTNPTMPTQLERPTQAELSFVLEVMKALSRSTIYGDWTGSFTSDSLVLKEVATL